MKIVIATGLYPPEIGGPATHTALLEKELPSHGFEIVTVPFSRVRHLPKFLRHGYYTWLLLRASRGADLFYALDPVSVGLPTFFASVLTMKPYILRVVGDYAWEQAQNKQNTDEPPHEFSTRRKDHTFFIRSLQKVQTLVAMHAEKIITPSNYMKGIVSNWGADTDRIVVIHNPASRNKKLKSKGELKKLLLHSGKLLFTAGRLIPLKRFEVLIDVLPNILKEFPDTKLVIAGEGPERDKLTKHIEIAGLFSNVTLLGSIPKQKVFEYMRAADVFVLNSTHETFSHVVLEAMEIGTPVVATKVGGNTEIIEDGKSGLLVTSGDEKALAGAILHILKDDAYALQLAEGAYERLKIFEKDRIIEGIIDVMKVVTKR